MSRVSQNGYTAAKTATGIPSGVVRIRPKGADRGSSAFTVRRDIAGAFQYLIDQYQARVEDIDLYAPGDDWGYTYREIRGGGALSNHSSATAVDINSTRHPLGVPTRRGLSQKQIAEVHQILRELDGVIRWGGDFVNRPDAMHFEICDSPEKVKAAVAKLPNPTPPGDDDVVTQADIDKIAKEVLTGDGYVNNIGFASGSAGRYISLADALEGLMAQVKKIPGAGTVAGAVDQALANDVAAVKADVKALGEKLDAVLKALPKA